MGGFRPAPVYIVADGQSLVRPPTDPPTGWPWLMCDDLGYPTPYVPAIAGAPWERLGTVAQMHRRTPYAHAGLSTFYIMLGGQTDLVGLGALLSPASGATTYSRMTTMAGQCRTAGYEFMIGCTIPPAASITGGAETERVAYNALVIANGASTFDAIVDIDNTPGLDDNTNLTYYMVDEIHWTQAGHQLAADTIAPYVLALL
jgi:hypothetical protein